MAGLRPRNRTPAAHPKWDPDDYEFDCANITALAKAAKKGCMESGSAKEKGWGQEAAAAPRSGRSPVCQVLGCGKDLTEFKEYLQRYRICEYHRTLSSLVKDGVHQRFCQQCGKFQLLEEFDRDKRTCRRKLERHNARRRKRRLKHGGRGAGDSGEEGEDEGGEEAAAAQEQSSGSVRKQSGGSNSQHGDTAASRSESSKALPSSPKARTAPTRRSVRPVRHAAAAAAVATAAAVTATREESPEMERSVSGESGLGLSGLLGQLARGASVTQDDLEALLAAPLSEADAQRAFQAVFGAWGGSEGSAALQSLPRSASRQLAQIVNALSIDIDAMDLDLGDFAPTLADFLPEATLNEQSSAAMPAPKGPNAAAPPLLGPTSKSLPHAVPKLGDELAWQVQRAKRGPGFGPRSMAASLLVSATATPELSSCSGVTAFQPGPVPPPRRSAELSLLGPMLGTLEPHAAQQQQAQQNHSGSLPPNYYSTATSSFTTVAATAPAAATGPPPTVTDECIANEEFDTLLAQLFGEEGGENVCPLSNDGLALASSQPVPLAAATLLNAPSAPLAFLEGSATFSASINFDVTAEPAMPTPFAPTPSPLSQPPPFNWNNLAGAPGMQAPAPLQLAVGMLSGAQAPQPAAQDRLVRMSMKMFDTTPDLLPTQLRAELAKAVASQDAHMEGYLRPGCVHLTLNTLLDQGRLAGLHSRGVRSIVESMLAEVGMASLREGTVLVQLGDELAVVESGRVVQVVSVPGSAGIVPAITAMSRLAIWVEDMARQSIVVRGRNLVGPNHRLLCRHQGTYPLLEVIATSASARPASPTISSGSDGSPLDPRSTLAASCLDSRPCSPPSSGSGPTPGASAAGGEAGAAAAGGGGGEGEGEGEEWIEFRLPTCPLGLVEVEMQRGAFLSGARPLLLLPCPRAAAELNELLFSTAGCMDRDSFLEGIGFTLRTLVSAAQQGGTAGLSMADVARAAGYARGAAAVAAFRGWPAVMRLVLPAVVLDCSPEAAVATMGALCPPGQSLLHTAVASASGELLEVLRDWGRTHCLHWRVDEAGAGGVTPLHLAALLRSPSLLRALWELDPAAAKHAWIVTQAADGLTPAQYAQLSKAAAPAQAAQPAPQRQYSQLVAAVQELTVSPPAPPAAQLAQLESAPSSSASLPPPSAFAAASARADSPGASCSSMPPTPVKGKAQRLPSTGLDMLLEAAQYCQGGKAMLAGKLGAPQEQQARAGWAAGAQHGEEGPIKPHARRPALPGGGGPPVPDWVTRRWAQEGGAAALVASLREGLDESAQEHVQHLLRQL